MFKVSGYVKLLYNINWSKVFKVLKIRKTVYEPVFKMLKIISMNSEYVSKSS